MSHLLIACALTFLPGLAIAQQAGDVYITELLANPGGTISDASGEWFELYNNTPQPIDLEGWAVRDSAASGSRPLHVISSSVVIPPFGFVVLGNTTNTTSNGGVPVDYAYGAAMAFANSLDRLSLIGPDGVTLIDQVFYASAAISTVNGVSRERLELSSTSRNMDSALWANGATVYGPGGSGTPGAAGQTPTATPALSAVSITTADAGYRLLAPPVAALTVDSLAQLNLVQGLPDEFPGFGVNLFTGYTGYPVSVNNGFTAPTSRADWLQVGRGLLWYMYTEGGPEPEDPRGISRRAPLPLALQATGFAVASDVSTTFSVADREAVLPTLVGGAADDQFYLLGNPFNEPFDLSGVSASSGTLSAVFQVYDPVAGYQIRTAVPGTDDGNPSDDVAVWEGFFAEFFDAPTLPVAITYDADARTPILPDLEGTTGGQAQYRQISLRLSGTTATGRTTTDEAAVLYFSPSATDGWDRLDASKLSPLSLPHAGLAPVGPGADAEPRLLAQRSLPYDLVAPQTVPLALTTSEPGIYTVSVNGFDQVPSGWLITLEDRETGSQTQLAAGSSYAFESDAVVSAERFALHLSPGVVAGEEEATGQASLSLAPVSPNPSAAGARTSIQVRDAQTVRATVFDLLGREVRDVFVGSIAAGASQVLEIPEGLLPAGTYVLRVTGASGIVTRTFTVRR